MSEEAIAFIAELFGDPITQAPIYFSSLANERDGSGEVRLATRDPEQVTAFIRKHDRPGRGLFVCAGTVNGKRNKDNILESAAIYTDIDFKDHPGVPAEAIRTAIGRAKLPPSIVVSTGHGYHVWYLFHAAVNSQTYRDRLESLLRALAVHFGGDPQVAEISRLMRLPGTHNTKYDSWVPVTAEITHGNRYSLNDLEGWLLTNTRPLLQRRAVDGPPGPPGGAPADSNPFTRLAQEQGYKPPVDVEALIAGMVARPSVKGESGANGDIREAQLKITAALIERGEDPETAIKVAVDAAMAAAERAGIRWDRGIEERKWVRPMVRSWITGTRTKASRSQPTNTENVVDIGEARAARKPSPAPEPKQKKSAAPFVVADMLVKHLRELGEDIMLTEGEVWLYREGFWRAMSSLDEQRLRGMIHSGFDALKESGAVVTPNAAMLNLVWIRLTQNPDLYKANVPWADAGMVVCRNGVLHLDTGAFEKHMPENFARRHIGATFTPGAKCPIFEDLIADMFSDHPEGKKIVALIQEWTGAALTIGSLSREQRRALILTGASKTGKTELSKIFGLLFGDPIAAPSVTDIGEPRFGLAPLYGASAWVRDDAINEGDKLDPQRFKTVVTGEPVDVGRKRRDVIPGVRFNIPVLLTCNSLPRARDGSDAIYNRSLIVEMTHILTDQEAVDRRVAILGAEKAKKISTGAGIFSLEASGILNWALLGFARLRKRGFYDIPACVAAWIQGFKDENNPVGEWGRECVERAPAYRIENNDLVRIYNGWEHEQEGDEAITRGMRWLRPKLMKCIPGLGKYQAHGGKRYTTGLRATATGLAAWDSYQKVVTKAGGSSTNSAEVNQVHIEEEPE